MPERYRDYQPSLNPPWLNRKWGNAWLTAFGLVKDALVEAASQATLSSIVTRAPEDALAPIGAERDIERAVLSDGSSESAPAYQARLANAWDAWEQAGTDLGIVNRLAEIGLTARCVRNNQWDWDEHTGNPPYYWARFWAIIDQPHPYTLPATWDSGTTWNSNSTWNIGGATAAHFAYLRRLVTHWKASHAQLVNIVVVISGSLWDDGSTWDSGVTWDSGSVAYL